MATYKAPIRDMMFVLYEVMNADKLPEMESFEEATRDLVEPILEEAGKIAEEVLFPLNRSGDEEGCIWSDGKVSTPTGFKEAYKTFCEGGWTGLACDPAYGGMGMPKAIDSMIAEMICSSNLSFGMYPGLSHGAYHSLHTFGSDDMKDMYLPKLVDGSWSGTMCLTEPHCGTDLGLCRTKAEPQSDGSYGVTGTKIFISAGEHDMTENIIHLVLARTPDAPEGIKGISLFIVPKFIPDDQGDAGEANGVTCGSIEHKMGIKASSTCVMNFDGAKGWLVGELNKGMRGMFAMMNAARLAVGMQGLGLAEASYQGAVEYAKERLQGRSLSGVKHPDKPADPIIVHPDVRRMLMTQRAYIEGCRAMGAWVAEELDISRRHADDKRREEADEFVQLMTPIVKALFTDLGFECTNIGMQVFGGHGFIREHGMEQYVRDCRIAQIYEGTNGIQALDLIGRKMPAKAGRNLRRFFHPVQDYIEKYVMDEEMGEFVQPLAKAFGRLQQATGQLARVGMGKPEEAAAGATEYLRLFGLVALAYMWCRMVEASKDKADEDESGFYGAKITTARFYMEKLLPQTNSLFASIMAGGASMMELDEELF
ncbi:Acyl-CoA dehydrogenase domain-containing protein [Candidatus Terasakiella magnetica]|uniref:3-methylmercaptopropionyl-CoA dehydrogenase n=1 Tax=Candidatus Terasakiella magnetica TaxID=1867952 RepID=A0A1C3RC18_9PROT|nr:acyl-CoA dehydrogenase C-terminal domain-containing protein [Candidatus Terasakiella magnetica]SCA54762.1 Acyl-CoA dehydrogenase domain-containing protein [Candidatus Terasakiella magnetica]